MTDLGFIHRYVPPNQGGSPVLLLLHGTGGDEQDLIPLGEALLPTAGILSLRGKVLENGMPRFFRRFGEGVFDLEDLAFRTNELSQFLSAARSHYGLERNRFVAVGYSNGANIAASLLLSRPSQVRDAILLRAMTPFEPVPIPDLSSFSILMSEGEHDPVVPRSNATRLAEIFQLASADVQVHWHRGGHELGQDDIDAARVWLAARSLA
jgi:predicted esterase